MELTLSSPSPLKTTYTDAEGHEHYHTETKYRYLCCPSETTVLSSDQGSITTTLAKIRWHVFTPTIIEYRGTEMRRSDYIKKSEWFGLRGKFTASDGQPYIWISGAFLRDLRLHTDDDNKTVIAYSRRSNLGIFGPKRKASLTIADPGLHIVDDIVVTFTYMNQIRRERPASTGLSSVTKTSRAIWVG